MLRFSESKAQGKLLQLCFNTLDVKVQLILPQVFHMFQHSFNTLDVKVQLSSGLLAVFMK